MRKEETAVARFKEGYSCSQAILSSFGEDLGLGRDTAFKVAAGFGGGMARMGETCGAVTGAFMVIGLKHGAVKANDRQAKDKTYGLVKEFVKRFKARNKTVICRELLGCDLGTPEGLKTAQDKGLITNLCPRLVKDAGEILQEIL